MSARLLKRGILLFWSVWLGIIAVTNGFSFLAAVGYPSRFASHNYELVRNITAKYGTPADLALVMFGAIVLWQAVAALRFWEAARLYRPGHQGAVYRAFGMSLALFGMFLVAGEIFLHFEYEAIHMRIGMAQLLSLLVITLLPE